MTWIVRQFVFFCHFRKDFLQKKIGVLIGKRVVFEATILRPWAPTRLVGQLLLLVTGINEDANLSKREVDDVEDDPPMKKLASTYFPEDRRPARTTVGVTALAVGALVEIDCVARRP